MAVDADERSASAGEYVLGTLDARDRADFERALADDAALQAEVYAWQDLLLGLSARVPAAAPRLELWSRIEAGLAGASRTAAPEPSARRAPAAAVAEAANDPLWRRLRRWQAASALAVAASLVLATLLVLRAPVAAPGERYLALLQAPDKSTGWIVEGAAGGALRLVPLGEAPPVPAGKSMQFWTKPDGAAGPTSLGLVRGGQSVELPVARLPGLGEKQLFELTLEPEGGSPLGRPTGPVLYIGRTVRI